MSDSPTEEQNRPAAQGSRLFRREAVDHHMRARHEAHLLRLTPAWALWTYRLLVAVCVVALAFGIFGSVNDYASGTAIVRMEERLDVTARAAGTVTSVEVSPGQHVAASQVLVRLYSASEAAELRRIENEFELQLVKMLREPGDVAARGALTTLRVQRELAMARIDERTLRAPRAGRVSDIRIRPGQQLEPGELAVSLTGDDSHFRVVAMLPGQYRPLLRPGMPLRLELNGFPYAYQTLTIESVGNEVVGPAEVRRYLRQSDADSIRPEGSLVLVEARLPTTSFTDGGRTLGFYEGMQGRVEIAIRSENILLTLIPGLKAIRMEHGS